MRFLSAFRLSALRLLLALLLPVVMAQPIHSRSRYCSVHNRFASLTDALSGQVACSIDDASLAVDNSSSRAVCAINASRLGDSYTYTVRAASLRNKPGASPAPWGIAFDYADDKNYSYASVWCENTAPYDDLTDRRLMHVAVGQVRNGVSQTLDERELEHGVDLYDGLNTLAVTVSGQEATVKVGKKKLRTVVTVKFAPLSPSGQAGLYLGKGSKVSVERTVATTDHAPTRRVATSWTREALEQHFATSSDPVEGYWQYQDRDMEDNWLRLGGRYTIGIVAADDGYDIIYVCGGQVNADRWSCGLLKGHISKTIFDAHYDLTWIDATFVPITLDAYATFENGVLASFHFPVYKSQVRFSKVLKL